MTETTVQLLDMLEVAAAEKGILIADGASINEVSSAQRSCDKIKDELLRRMAW